MRKSDALRASAAAGSDRIALVAGALAGLIVFAAAMALAFGRYGPALERVALASNDVSLTIGRSIAADLERAIALGIPLQRAPGVEPYLAAIRVANPTVAAIAVVDAAGTPLAASPSGTPVFGPETVRAPVLAGGAEVGAVVLLPSGLVLDGVRQRLTALAIAFGLLTAVGVAAAVRIWRLERIDLPEARYVAGGRAVARGAFADYTVPPPGPFAPLGLAAARMAAPVRRSHRRLLALTDEVRALDVSGAFRGRVERALAPVRAHRFDRPLRRRTREAVLLWWPLLALCAVTATRPLVASFAADRIGAEPLASFAVAGAVGGAAAGSILGLVVAILLDGRLSKLVTFLSLVVAAVAVAAVAVVRDAEHFVALQIAAGAAGWCAVWTATLADGSGRRRPWHGALVFLAALAIGPTLGAIVAEATGRRMAFLAIGGLLALAALASLLGGARRRRAALLARLTAGETFALAAVGLATAAWLDIELSVALLRENYAGLAVHAATFGVAALIPAAFALGLPTPLAAAIPALALAGVVAADVAGPVATAAIGIGLGLLVTRLGTRTFRTAPLIALLAGAIVAAALHAAAAPYLYDATDVSAAAAGLLALLSLLLAGKAQRERRR